MPECLVIRVPQGEITGINFWVYLYVLCVGIAGARRQRQSSDYYLVTPTIELQLTQIDSPPRLAPSRPRTFGVVSLVRCSASRAPSLLLPRRCSRCRRLLEEVLVLLVQISGGGTM